MFFQPPEEEPQNIIIATQNPTRRRRKKKITHKNKQYTTGKAVPKRKQLRFANTMSSWAESFTFAATWQLKHQIAYWKSKAKALEYENRILHDIIRKNYVNNTQSDVGLKTDACVNNCNNSVKNDNSVKIETEIEEEDEEMNEDHDDFEVSEEFIKFLTANAKFKEDARLEREKLKAKFESENSVEILEAGPSGIREDTYEKLKELYGCNWQRIAALEMSLQSQFINECDKNKPTYWPNIPFNFNYS